MATNGYLTDELSKKTSLLGLKLWVVLGIGVGGFIVIILFALAIWLFSRKKCRNTLDEKLPVHIIPNVSKEIQEVQIDKRGAPSFFHPSSLMQPKSSGSGEKAAEKVVVHVDATKVETNYNLIAGKKFGAPETTPAYVMQSLSRYDTPDRALGSPAITASDRALGSPAISVSDEKKAGVQMECAERVSHGSLSSRSLDSPAPGSSEVSHLGWGHWYTLKDLEAATNCFSESNVVGEGGYGIVFKGQVQDGGMIAVKNLLNNKGQAEKEFRVEVEAIGRVRHKNLVRLLGYCAEGAHRMLVYEYVNNGNLDQWLHGPLARSNSLSWDARMKIVLGTAKALAYLHEALEPKVVHRDIKSSNILIDTHYNAKISDFGLAKLLGSEKSHVTTRVMGTFGYVAPEYANTGLLNECSDVYSFGVLLMEVITGRDPVDYSRTPGEVNLVDWLKLMVGNRRSEEVADPNLKEKPTPRALKRALLIALRCVDPDSSRRPKMGHVVHMLEAEDFPFKDDRRVRDGGRQKQVDAQRPPILSRKNGGPTLDDDDDTDGFDSPNKNYKAKQWRRYEG